MVRPFSDARSRARLASVERSLMIVPAATRNRHTGTGAARGADPIGAGPAGDKRAFRGRGSASFGTRPPPLAFKLGRIEQQGITAVGLFTKDIETMDDLLLHGLKDIYYAENQIIKSLPKLIEKATNRDLSKPQGPFGRDQEPSRPAGPSLQKTRSGSHRGSVTGDRRPHQRGG